MKTDDEIARDMQMKLNRDRRAGRAATALLESLGYVFIDHADRWDPPVDIPVGESQTIRGDDVGHASSLFGNLGGN